MSIGKINTNGDKGSNFNWQKRMLQMLSLCCLGNTVAKNYTQAEIDAGVWEVGTIIFNSDTVRFEGWNGTVWVTIG